MKLSIIIPVYKVEEYVQKCLESIVAQDIPADDYEIIVINDGSPDNSKEIILEFQKHQPNLLFIDQENQGVSVARNRGLDVAKGDYILFIDPDDTIEENSLGTLLQHADEKAIDVMYLGLDSYDENGVFLFSSPAVGDENNTTDGFSHGRRTYPATLYKSKCIGDIRFVKGILRGQDSVFNAMVQSKAQRCTYFGKPYYKYTQRQDSSRQFVLSDKVFHSNLFAISVLNDFQKEHFPDPNAQQKKYFDEVISLFVQRSFEWNILPQKNKKNFNQLKSKLNQLGLDYILNDLSQKIKNCNQPFYLFLLLNWLDAKRNQLASFFKTK
ncbi:glycosyltransferase [Flavobacterium sp.]|uniref:glycosyltransferase n=1 Tax=Flavobacterium sp. TaxID=239 RepID=UPI002B4B939F|nr:glycosyltransferase [Flavobacterium sp.]HLP65530.1 glycosyltransferase [Flavobacterium sp.]